MMSSQSPLVLTRTDTTRNMARFYVLSVEPALFAGAALLRQWGRIGTRGRTRVELFACEAEAWQALSRLAAAKTRRGYRPVASG
ncbi:MULTISPECIES: WGR domain-containing protein [Alphaproteobacteria]|uniref:WGR domain-containing protein n=2 Tax=Alphaproteobacteria TaxID=28211 RepID=A0A512HGU8_9HYPH|nr:MULTISPECIES: WGR domain-containing protein [Alphaproteobacteria]GEO84677.1 WGR domain-containing protein [Ciceribacter naphthalenivorans]GLR20702.1 WGR domain-containing protein [Ciceribacter naphthalenivorans]GLT03558.1 WGR domain-containing protein [Sphingomonas psychrolutea]